MENKIVEIQLVEDNPNDAELAVRAFKKRNLANNLHWVKDGEEALDFLFSKDIDTNPRLILLDLKLPKVSGLQVLKQIIANDSLKTIPVVMPNSSKEGKDLSDCYLDGANSNTVKPVEFEKFINTVTEIGLYWLHLNQPIK